MFKFCFYHIITHRQHIFFLQVLLVYKGKGFCGGVIYKPTWILTASHCLEDTDKQFLKIIAGEFLKNLFSVIRFNSKEKFKPRVKLLKLFFF